MGRKEDKIMLKKDLLEILKDVEDNVDINEKLQGIEGLAKSSELDVTKLSLEDYKNILENNETIKGYNQSSLDSAISKAVESFKTKKMPSYIEEAIKAKSNEGKTPEQIELEKMKAEIENMKAEKTMAEMSSKYTKVLGEKGLSTDLIDFVLGSDDDTTNLNIEKINTILNTVTESKVKEKLNNSSYVPPKQDVSNLGKVTWEQVIENPNLMTQYNAQQ